MKYLMNLIVCIVSLSAFAHAEILKDKKSVAMSGRNPLEGSWRLVSVDESGPGGAHVSDAKGLFLFRPDGHAAVQVMYKNTKSEKPSEYTTGGYEATFGTYEVNEAEHTFIYKIEGSLVRKLIGKELPRKYQITGNNLVVSSGRPGEKWSVTWEKL